MLMYRGTMPKNDHAKRSAVTYLAAIDAIEVNVMELAQLASKLDEKEFDQTNEIVKNCGLYEQSQEWKDEVGLTAQSGISGVVWANIPGVGGVCAYQPRINRHGNSP